MAGSLIDKAPAKVNLTLRVVGRRDDGYHCLESLVAFADVADRLTFEPGPELVLDVDGAFAADSGPAESNLVLKAARLMAEVFPGLVLGRFGLTKTIPVAAGLGGGSSDAAAALRLLARANAIAADDVRLVEVAAQVGADVPVCLAARARIMRGVGDRLSPPVDLPAIAAVLVNPGVAVSTRDVFGGLDPVLLGRGDDMFGQLAAAEVAALPEPLPNGAPADWLAAYGNDLTASALSCAPVIGDVLAALADAGGCRLSRMSGSGATCFGLFDDMAAAQAAALALGLNHPGWWIAATTLR